MILRRKQDLALFLSFVLLFVTVFPAFSFGSQEAGTGTGSPQTAREFEFVPGFIPSGFQAGHSERTEKLLGADVLPERYNAVDEGLVPAVRNQIPNGTCWAFSILDTAWISMKAKYGTDPEDLYSPFALAYFFYHTPLDPLKNIGWDSNTYSGKKERGYLDAGGSTIMASLVLAGRVGPAPEAAAPYEKATPGEAPNPKTAFRDAAMLDNAFFLDYNANSTTQTKRALQEYGALSVSYCATVLSGEQKGKTHFYTDPVYGSCHYQNDTANRSDHVVVIVGWDDTVPASAFAEDPAKQPAGDGAWLIRNSWGSDYQEAKQLEGEGVEAKDYPGYFWLSYYEPSINEIAALDLVPEGTYDRCYEYDGSAWFREVTIPTGASCGNIYRAEEEESLTAVMNAFSDSDVDYSVQIYTSEKQMANPADGTPVFEEPVRGETWAAGIYTLTLPTAVHLKKGSWFSVVYTNEGKKDKALLAEFSQEFVEGEERYNYYNDAQPGQSYYGFSGEWADLAEDDTTFRIKALTVDPVMAKKLNLPEDCSINKGETWSFGINAEPDNAVLQLSASSSDEAVLTAGIDQDGCVQLKAVRMGNAVVTVTDAYSGSTGTFKVTVTDNYDGFYFEQEELKLKAGASADNKVIFVPEQAQGDELAAAVLDPSVASAVYKNGAVTVSGKAAGSTKVYLISQKTERQASFAVTVEANGGGTGGGSSSGGGVSQASLTTGLTYSANFKQIGSDWYFFPKGSTRPLADAWLCDNEVAANGTNVWYLFGSDGKMVVSPFVQDAGGNYYSLETSHNGYYGSLRYKNGTYDGIYMEFSQKHDGTFGAITNQAAIDALKAKYKVYKFGRGNESAFYSKNLQ